MSPTMTALAQQYRQALLNDVIPFWERHSLDREYGGYFTCLDRDGAVFDTDKFLWLQARQVWTFSMLYQRLEPRESWRAIACQGVEFLRQHGTDEHGDWYFALTRDGQPLVQPYNIFSDCFAAMAFSQYARATGDLVARQIAERSYRAILRRKDQPKGRYSKAVPGTRPLVGLALPMILANLSVELEWMLEAPIFEQAVDMCMHEVFGLFLDQERGILHEHVAPDGSWVDSFDGRLINPGHGIEAMWFLLDIAERRNDLVTIGTAVEVILNTLELGWDQQQGGIFYFLDAQGRPPQQLEWDQKLWWVHVEALVALLKSYRLTRRAIFWEWFERVHAYTWSHFPDPLYGEWYGYLNRAGEVLLPLKGGKWKGCYHLPRALFLCMREFALLEPSAAASPSELGQLGIRSL